MFFFVRLRLLPSLRLPILSIVLSVRPSARPSIHQFVHPSVRPIHPLVRPSVRPFVHPFVCSFHCVMDLLVCPILSFYVRLPRLSQSVILSVCLSVVLPIRAFFHPLVICLVDLCVNFPLCPLFPHLYVHPRLHLCLLSPDRSPFIP